MVFYFSGTGNSQLAAKGLAEALQEELVSLHGYLKGGERAVFQSARPLVFVAPTYAWRMPRAVDRWIRETDFGGNRDAYFILTCGGSCGNGAAYAKKLCRDKGLRFRGLAPVVMPDNYVVLEPPPAEPACRALRQEAETQIAALAREIQAGRPLPEPPRSLLGGLLSGPVNGLFYACMVKDKKFAVSDACISCGKCVRRCPLNNVVLVEGKPVWQGNCTHCMACINGCPVQAIEYGAKTKGRRRYFILEDAPGVQKPGERGEEPHE